MILRVENEHKFGNHDCFYPVVTEYTGMSMQIHSFLNNCKIFPGIVIFNV